MRIKRDRNFWKNHIETFKKSGLIQAEYCRKNNIDRKYLSRLLTDEKKQSISNNDLVELKPSKQQKNSSNIILKVSEKYQFQIPQNFSKESILKLLDILDTRL